MTVLRMKKEKKRERDSVKFLENGERMEPYWYKAEWREPRPSGADSRGAKKLLPSSLGGSNTETHRK